MPSKHPHKVPQKMQAKFDAITDLTDGVCQEYLSDEYAELARQMAAALARKRPSPLLSGWDKSWACGIVYALGQVNYLFDKSQTPHMRADALCELFGVASSTGGNKAKEIRNLLDIGFLDPDWTLPSRIDDNPMAWYIMVNGLIVDARSMPYKVQAIAHEKGLIPYIPADEEK